MMPAESVLNLGELMVGAVCLGGYLYHTYREPRRLLCGLLLVWAIYFGWEGISGIWSPDIRLPDGSLIVSVGNSIFFFFDEILMGIGVVGGVLLCINGMFLMHERVSLSHLLPIFFGVSCVFMPILEFFVVQFYLLVIPFLVMMQWVLFVPMMLFAFFLHTIVYACLPKPKTPAYIIVPGEKLRKDGTPSSVLTKQLRKALTVWEKRGGNARFVLSGGKGLAGDCTKASVMQAFLLEQGVPEDKILPEEQACTVAESIQFSKEIIQAHGEQPSIIVAGNYHILHTVILAKKAGMDAQGIGSRTGLFYFPMAFLREIIAAIFGYKKLLLIYLIVTCAWVLVNWFL